MIYLVTADQELFENDIYKIISVEESLQLLEPLRNVGLDTETEGLDPYTKKLKSIQLGCFDFQVVIDTLTIDPLLYKEYLESDRLFIGWNLKFDLKFLFHQRIIPRKVWDGFLAEKLMWLGYPAGIHSLSLKSAGEEYLGVELDKSVRGKIIWAGLTTDVIEYSANDVKYLEQIMDKQIEKLKKQDLMTAIEYENRFVFPLAYCEYCGVRLDEEKWQAKMAKDSARVKEAEDACNRWLIQNEPNSKYIFIDRQGDLFTGFNLEPQVRLNWNSAKQLIPLFKKYGVEVEVEDKDKGGTKDSIDAKCLKPQKDKCSLIPIYLEYKEAVKVTSTYGQNFLDQINPISHRIHTNYTQMGADTTRITSGGKDKGAGVEYVNLLNLPADAETRSCFIAEDGNKWISIDYSGQETYLMASIANDTAIIDELTNGSGDIHSLTAYMSYMEIPRDTPIKDIKKLYHNLRQEAKGIEFAINYGGNADTIHMNKGIPIKEAEKIYNNYMSGFSGLKRYQDACRKAWWNQGYILLSPLTKHKAYIYDYDRLKAVEARLTYEFYAEARAYKGQENKLLAGHKKAVNYIVEKFAEGVNPESLVGPYTYYKKSGQTEKAVTVYITLADAYRYPIKYYFRRKSDSEKQSINYRIQAAGSMCLRVTLCFFFWYLVEKGYIFDVKICIPPYDEVNCEAPEPIAEEVAQKLYECMVKAGSYFCTRCKLDADMSRLDDGSLPTYWIH